MSVRKFDAVEERVESGPIQFGDDWPGYFMRGDNVAALLIYFESYKGGSAIMDKFFESMIEDMRRCLKTK